MQTYTQKMSFERVCNLFKNHADTLEHILKYCTIDAEITYFKYGYFQTVVVELTSLDDVVQCILKYK